MYRLLIGFPCSEVVSQGCPFSSPPQKQRFPKLVTCKINWMVQDDSYQYTTNFNSLKIRPLALLYSLGAFLVDEQYRPVLCNVVK